MRRSIRAGFSLVEVVIALGLGVLLVAAVQTLVVQAYRTSQRMQADERFAELRRLPLELCRADLAGQPIVGGLELRDGVLTLETLCDLEGNTAAVRLAIQSRYRTQSDGAELSVVRAQRPMRDPRGWSANVVIASGLKSFEVDVSDGQRWHPRWPTPTPRMPRALRIRLEGMDGVRLEEVFPVGTLLWKRHDG